MSQFATGINALRSLRVIMGLAGDNVSNVDTPGYHARRAEVAPLPGPTRGNLRMGNGSIVQTITRLRDELTERLLVADLQVMERVTQESEILNHVELTLQEPSQEGVDARLGRFFEGISRLAADPDDQVHRHRVIQEADSLCIALNRLATKLRTLQQDGRNQLHRSAERVNDLVARTATLNERIAAVEVGGVAAPGLKDRRDRTIQELAELIDVRTHRADFGVVNVSTAGTLLVDGEHHFRLEARETDDGMIVAREGGTAHRVDIREGKVAGLLEGLNNYLPAYRDRLDELANALRREFNLLHTTGLGLNGRFRNVDGLNEFYGENALCRSGYGVTAGTSERLVVNVEDRATGEVTPYELTVDTTQLSDDFLADLRDKINTAVDHVSATIEDHRLCLAAEDGFAFGFATPYDPNPAEPGDITAATPSEVGIIDAYQGTQDLGYTFNFVDGGTIGSDEIEVDIDVRRRDGTLIRTLTRTVPADYQPGSGIALEQGLKFTLGQGGVNAGDTFSFMARASNDTAGVLDALGLNSFFNGLGAEAIRVTEPVKQDPGRIAAALTDIRGDNHRLLQMESLKSARVLSSGTASLLEHYRSLLSDVGAAHATRSAQQMSLEGAVKELRNEVDSTSGVSVDEQMVKLLDSRRIYQAAVRYIKSVDSTLADLLSLI